MRRLFATMVLCFSLGCYAAVPSSGPSPAIGSRLVVTLTDAGTTAMAAMVGPTKGELIGDLTEATDTTIVLALRTVTNQRGIEEIWNGEQVTVPRSAIRSLESRKITVWRSALLALVVSTAAIALASAIGVGGFGTERGGEGGTTQ